MAAIDQSSRPHDRPRHIVFLGETGAGKSSIIDLINACPSVAESSNDTGAAFKLWNTRDLGEGFFTSLFRGSSKGELIKFLRERHQKREIDLLVYCVRGSSAHKAMAKHYDTFCAITRQLAAPVVIVVTHLEREKNTEDWWERNEYSLRRLGMEFDGHACITAPPNYRLENESKRALHDLIARNYGWQAKNDGPSSYFGSTIQRHRTGGAHNDLCSEAACLPTDTTRSEAQNPVGERSNSGGDGPVSSPLTPTSYHTAYDRTLPGSGPATPVVGPPSPAEITCATFSVSTCHSKYTVPSQASSEEIDSTNTSLGSMFPERHATIALLIRHHPICLASSGSSCSSQSELHPPPLVKDHGGTELRYGDLTAVIKKRIGYPSRCGGFGDIWECDLMIGETPRKVAVKAVRVVHRGDAQCLAAQKKKLNRELIVWAKLQHENIVQLLGVVSGFGVLPSMVSPWFSNGSLSSYLSKHQTMDPSGRQRLLFDITSGLRYLHSQDVVHGDLHSGNVLIDDNGRACLTDFGLSLIIREFVGTSYLKSSVCGSVRYADPELVRQVHADAGVVYPTKSSDVYSFGGLTLYVLSGKQPYEGIREILVIASLLKGKRPKLPDDDERISPGHKSLIQRCWSSRESERPSVEDIVSSLQVGSV